MRTEYDLKSTMRAARERYFELNGFGKDGGYDDAWVDFHLGPLPCPFPNTKSRIRAVKTHDLHHILTGYRTDLTGEFEISAWELGAGCKDFAAAWYLNLAGLATGMLIAPRRIFRAFLRGRRTDSLYGLDVEELLEKTVAEMRTLTKVDEPIATATFADIAWFAAAMAVGGVVAWTSFVLALFVVPIGLILGLLRKAKKREALA